MKLPHISIEYRSEETFAPDTVSLPLVVGFGLHWAWVWLVIFNGPVVFYPNNPQLFYALFVATICVFAATLLCYGAFLQQFRALFGTKTKRLRNRAVGTACTLAGTALLWGLNTTLSPVPIIGASALLAGIGSAVLLMSFGVSTSVLDIAEAVTCTALALAVGTVVFVLVMLASEHMAILAAVLCLCLPMLEFVCLQRCSHLVDHMEFSTATLSVHTAPFALHVCGPMFVLGFILGFLRPIALFEAHAGLVFSQVALVYVAAGVAVGLLAMGAMVMQRQRNNFMFRTLLPVCALLLALECLVEVSSPTVSVFTLFSTYIIVEACTWVMLSDISQRFRLSAFTVFGFGHGALAVGALIGYTTTVQFNNGGGYLHNFDVLAVIALALMLLGMALLPKNAELRSTLKLGKQCPALQGDEAFAQVSASEFAMAAQSFDSQQTPADTQEQPLFAESTAAPAIAPIDGPTAATGAKDAPSPGTNGTLAEGAPANDQEIPPADAATMAAIDEMQELVDTKEREQRKAGRFKRKCAAVADTYLLSRKETEVLFLLAKGRNAAAIQEQLFISAGTVNTHMRHIYRKLNVHSQQELIALVEEAEVDGWE